MVYCGTNPAARLEADLALAIDQIEAVGPAGRVRESGRYGGDMEEGRNAGIWTIGVAETGNEVGLDLSALATLPPAERKLRVANARTRLKSAGAHFVVDTLPDCLPVLERIQWQLLRGTLAT